MIATSSSAETRSEIVGLNRDWLFNDSLQKLSISADNGGPKSYLQNLELKLKQDISVNLKQHIEDCIIDNSLQKYSPSSVVVSSLRVSNREVNDFTNTLEAVLIEAEFFVDIAHPSKWANSEIGDIYYLVSFDLKSEQLISKLSLVTVYDKLLKLPSKTKNKRLFTLSVDPVQYEDNTEFFYSFPQKDSAIRMLLVKAPDEVVTLTQATFMIHKILKTNVLQRRRTDHKVQEFNKSLLNANYNLKFSQMFIDSSKVFFPVGISLTSMDLNNLKTDMELKFQSEKQIGLSSSESEILIASNYNNDLSVKGFENRVLDISTLDKTLEYLMLKIKIMSKVGHDIIHFTQEREYDEYIDVQGMSFDEIENVARAIDTDQLYYSIPSLVDYIQVNILSGARTVENLKGFSKALDLQTFCAELKALEPLSILRKTHLRKQYLLHKYFKSCIFSVETLLTMIYRDELNMCSRKFQNVTFAEEVNSLYPTALLQSLNIFLHPLLLKE